MTNPQRFAVSPSSRVESDALAFEIAASLKNMSSRPPSGTSKKPFSAAAAPAEAPRAGGAETKLYEVPRELIEIARATARSRRGHVGTLTPIAPRPGPELEAGAAAYAAAVSEGAAAHDPSLAAGSVPISNNPPERSELRLAVDAGAVSDAAGDAAVGAPADGEGQPSAHPAEVALTSSGRAWLYAGVLVALAYCAQLVWAW